MDGGMVARMRPGFEENWRRRFIERGLRFDDDAGIAGWTTSGLAARLRHFRRVWPGDAPGARWVDAGCGAGSYTRMLAEHGIRPLGLDYSLPSVQKARARDDGSICWLVGDATRLPIREGSVDGILCLGVMQALSGPDLVVQELIRAVRPGGQIWIDALNRRCIPTWFRRLHHRLRGRALNLRYDAIDELTRLLEKHGAEDVKVYWVPILPAALGRLQPWVESAMIRSLLTGFPRLGSLVSHAFLVSARRRTPVRTDCVQTRISSGSG
jgi:ubiquinone/menaquinone biosynthesis C-methylase UbiE